MIAIEFSLCIRNPIPEFSASRNDRKDGYWFTASETSYGFPSFSLLTDLRKTSKGFLINDTLIVQVEVTVMSTVKNFAL
ncbi:unnamed protein product [Camellia sinensis]